MSEHCVDQKALKPCPFCGGAVSLEQPRHAIGGDEWWGIVCRNTENLGGTCAIQQRPSRTKEAAIERWNRRALPEAGEVAGLVAEWTKAAEGVTPGPWRHYQVEDRAFVQRGPEGGFAVKGLSRDREQADAAWIARCSPYGIRTLLDALTRQSADIARLEKERDAEKAASDAVLDALKVAQSRAEAAEAALADLKAETARVLKPFARYIETRDGDDGDMPGTVDAMSYAGTLRGPVVRVNLDHLRAARALHSKVKS